MRERQQKRWLWTQATARQASQPAVTCAHQAASALTALLAMVFPRVWAGWSAEPADGQPSLDCAPHLDCQAGLFWAPQWHAQPWLVVLFWHWLQCIAFRALPHQPKCGEVNLGIGFLWVQANRGLLRRHGYRDSGDLPPARRGRERSSSNSARTSNRCSRKVGSRC